MFTFQNRFFMVGLVAAVLLSSCSSIVIPPVINSFSPSSGTVGTTVTISGSDFDPAPVNNTVSFNGTPAAVMSSTITEIVTSVPLGATTGPINVTVAGLTATSPTSFIVTPIITGLSPSTGSVGTTVIIAGTGFDTASANDIVKFNGTPAVVMSSTSTQIIATVPAGATTGPVTVTVAGQEAVSPINFTVN